MIKKKAVFLTAGLLAVLLFLPGLTGAQEKKSQLYFVGETAVKPSGVAKFEAAVKKEIELAYPLSWSAYSTADCFYYFLFPIENWGGIDGINKADAEWMAKIGDKLQDVMKSMEGAVHYYRHGVIRSLPELSYVPKMPRLKPEEEKYISWGYAYPEFGKEKEFADVMKQWVEESKNKNTAIGWNTFVVESGTEMPLYFWAESAKSAVDYFTESEKDVNKIGPDKNAELGAKTMATLRKIEIKTGRPRPDLSSVPKK